MRSSLSSGKGKGSSSPSDGCFKYGAHLQRDCNARKSTGKQSSGKQSTSWSKSEGKGKSEKRENPKEPKSANQGAKGSHKGKTSKLVSQVLKTRNRRQARKLRESAQTCTADPSWNDGWTGDEWNDG